MLYGLNTLWTRSRVESQVATRNTFRVFPTQEKLLSFIAAERSSNGNIDKWIPFSIEFISEAELHELSTAAQATHSSALLEPASFSTPQGQVKALFTREELERPTTQQSIFTKRKGQLDTLMRPRTALAAATDLAPPEEPAVGLKRPREGFESPSARSPSPAPNSPPPKPSGEVLEHQHSYTALPPCDSQKPRLRTSGIVHEAGPLLKERTQGDLNESTAGMMPLKDSTFFNGVSNNNAARHSTQSKFFAAMTREGLQRYLEVVPYPQQHLFELILLSNPCRVYFDIERDIDQSSHDLRRFTELRRQAISDHSSEVGPPTTTTVDERIDNIRYLKAYLKEVGAGRAPTCPFGCDHCVPSRDIDFVVSVLLKYWKLYLDERRPELGLGSCLPPSIYEQSNDTSSKTLLFDLSGASVGASTASKALMAQQITVLQSIPLQAAGDAAIGGAIPAGKPAKFSIHVVFKFLEDASQPAANLSDDDDDEAELLDSPDRRPRHSYRKRADPIIREVVLNSNASVGDLVQGFVSFLYETIGKLQRTLLAHELKIPHEQGSTGQVSDKENMKVVLEHVRRQYQELHTALFYHAETVDMIKLSKKEENKGHDTATTTESISEEARKRLTAAATFNEDIDAQYAPRLQLKCLIDTAVYSKNRMMRCMGSSKLGKKAVLLPYTSPYLMRSTSYHPTVTNSGQWWRDADFVAASGGISTTEAAITTLAVERANQTSLSSFDVQQRLSGTPSEGDHLPAHLAAAFFGTMVSLHHMSVPEMVSRLLRQVNVNKSGAQGVLNLSTGSNKKHEWDANVLQQSTLAHMAYRRATLLPRSDDEALWGGMGGGLGSPMHAKGGFDSYSWASSDARVPSVASGSFALASESRELLCDAYPKGRTVIIVPNGMSLADWGHKGGHRMHQHHNLGNGGSSGSGRQRATSISQYNKDNSVQMHKPGPTSLPELNELILLLGRGDQSAQGPPSSRSGLSHRSGHLPRIYNHLMYFDENAALLAAQDAPAGVTAIDGDGSSTKVGNSTAPLKDRHLSALVITVTGYRYCRNVKRAHKSNDVYYTLFFDWAAETQQVPNAFGPLRNLTAIMKEVVEDVVSAPLLPLKPPLASPEASHRPVSSFTNVPVPKRTLLAFGNPVTPPPDADLKSESTDSALGAASSDLKTPTVVHMTPIKGEVEDTSFAASALSGNSEALAKLKELAALQKPPPQVRNVRTMLLAGSQQNAMDTISSANKVTYTYVDPQPKNICAAIQNRQQQLRREKASFTHTITDVDVDDPFDVEAASQDESSSSYESTSSSSSATSTFSVSKSPPRHIPASAQAVQATAASAPMKVKMKSRCTQAPPPPSQPSQPDGFPIHNIATQPPTPLKPPAAGLPDADTKPLQEDRPASSRQPSSTGVAASLNAKTQMHFSVTPSTGSAAPLLGLAAATGYSNVTKLSLLGVRCHQKCHDPDCNSVAGQRRTYRSEPLEVPAALWPVIERWAIGLVGGPAQ